MALLFYTAAVRYQENPLAPISEMFNQFITNSQNVYSPGVNCIAAKYRGVTENRTRVDNCTLQVIR